MGLFSSVAIFNALMMMRTPRDLLYSAIPMLITAGAYAHFRFPTKLGWLIMSALFSLPSVYGTISGLPYLYADIGVKYSGQTFIELLLLDAAFLLAVFALLYAAMVSKSVTNTFHDITTA